MNDCWLSDMLDAQESQVLEAKSHENLIVFDAGSKAGASFWVCLHGLGFCFHSTLETK